MDENNKFDVVGTNIAEKATMIWNVADAPEAWIDEKKTKEGYEIPMTRYFYEYQAPEPVEEIAVRLHELELDIQSSLDALFGEK